VTRVYKFIDASGREIHTVEDPDNKLPIPTTRQVIFIGTDRMQVESIETFGDGEACTVYFVRVRTTTGPN
jgi:hypothetical protein